MIPTTANTRVPHLGQPGSSTVQAAINQVVTRVNATQDVTGSLTGGPDFFGGNLGQREENDGTHDVAGSNFGQKHTGWKRTTSELLAHQSPVTITSVLEAEEGASVHRKRGGVLQVKRIHGGPGVIRDDAACIRIHDETRTGNLIEDQWGEFVVDGDRRLFARAGIFDELWVNGIPVLSLLTGGGATTDFEDGQFSIYDGADNTKVAVFTADSIATGTTRVFTFPNASGTLALTSDIAALGSFSDAVFELYHDAAPTAVGRFDSSNITPGVTRVFSFPDQDGEIALAGDIVTSHNGLTDLGDDDHTQYLLLAGRGGQTVLDNVTISSVLSGAFKARGAIVGSGGVLTPLVFEATDTGDNGSAGDGWRIPFLGESDASNAIEIAALQVELVDPTNGTETSLITISGRRGGLDQAALQVNLDDLSAVIATEVWSFASMADEDIFVRRGGVIQRLAVGAEGDVLTVVGGQVAWAAP